MVSLDSLDISFESRAQVKPSPSISAFMINHGSTIRYGTPYESMKSWSSLTHEAHVSNMIIITMNHCLDLVSGIMFINH